MGRREQLEAEVRRLQEQQEKALEDLAKVGPLEQHLDGLPDGSVITYCRRFGSRSYLYAAVKIDAEYGGRWFNTTNDTAPGLGQVSSANLVEALTSRVNPASELKTATAWTPFEEGVRLPPTVEELERFSGMSAGELHLHLENTLRVQ
jgi:hypothetical protein